MFVFRLLRCVASISLKKNAYVCLVSIFVDAGLGAASQLQDITDTGSNTRVLIIAVPTIVTNAVATGLVAWKAWFVVSSPLLSISLTPFCH